MSSRYLRFLVVTSLLPTVAGCASTLPSIYESAGDSTFGEANRQTMMAQVVNPEPVYQESMVSSGDHAAYAVERYNNDAVKEPENIRTTNAGNVRGSGGSSGSSSGSSGSN